MEKNRFNKTTDRRNNPTQLHLLPRDLRSGLPRTQGISSASGDRKPSLSLQVRFEPSTQSALHARHHARREGTRLLAHRPPLHLHGPELLLLLPPHHHPIRDIQEHLRMQSQRLRPGLSRNRGGVFPRADRPRMHER